MIAGIGRRSSRPRPTPRSGRSSSPAPATGRSAPGIDLRTFAEAARHDARRRRRAVGFLRLVAGEVEVPVVGAANATAVAGGFELLLGCDVVVASSAAAFGLPEVKRGLFAGSGGTHVGHAPPAGVALELTLTGDPIDAARAYELGLVNHVVGRPTSSRRRSRFAERIAANAPLSAARDQGARPPRAYGPGRRRRRGCSEWQPRVFTSEDAKEGATAFVEKRTPVWQGR